MLRSDEIFGILIHNGATERSYDYILRGLLLFCFAINIYEKTFADFNLVCAVGFEWLKFSSGDFDSFFFFCLVY